MKKVVLKTVIVGVIVLLLPFFLTMFFVRNKDASVFDAEDFEIYTEVDKKEVKLSFDEYLIGVIAANMPAGYHMEALKAQAVIARTYALYNISLLREENPGETRFSTSSLGLYYISLPALEQFWGSKDYASYFSKIENAVYGTEDEVLIYGEDLILPVFFDTGSGYTRNAHEAWGVEIPYLSSVESKQDVTSTNYLKITEYPVADMIEILKKYYTNLNVSENNFFNNVAIEERDSVGYVTKINLGDQTVPGEEFAKVLGLNSNHFYIEEYEDRARIICNGSGHGVGLSQYGANAMASEGYTYHEILKHYYSGVRTINMSEAD